MNFVFRAEKTHLQDTKIHFYKRLDTSPLAFNQTASESVTQTVTVQILVPEFNLSIPSTGDHLGCFMRMPQGADAHFIMSLDPVVQLGGLPVPDVELSICVPGHYVAVGEKRQRRMN